MADDVWSDELIGQAGECRSGADDVGKHEPVRAASQGGAFDVVVMAASLGGREVLSEVLRSLDESFPVPIVAVLHGAVSFALLGRRLGIDGNGNVAAPWIVRAFGHAHTGAATDRSCRTQPRHAGAS